MAYLVKEIFYTLQGEGFHSGRPAVFCRFSNCNLWDGTEEGREAAICKFCDTDFVGGTEHRAAESLAEAVRSTWRGLSENRFVVLTGGEPLLQVDEALIDALHAQGFEIAMETNGTVGKRKVAGKLDWLCVSPKAATRLKLTSGNELKLVYPQVENSPEQFEGLDFQHFYLQPCDGADGSTEAAIAYCLNHPRWNLSLQTHKIIGID